MAKLKTIHLNKLNCNETYSFLLESDSGTRYTFELSVGDSLRKLSLILGSLANRFLMSCEVAIGDKVFIDGSSGFCDPSYEVVTDIKRRFDEITGEEYNLICCGDQEYRGDTGECTKGASAYYMRIDD